MDQTVTSLNGVLIRLPEERWEHIIERHQVLASVQALVLDTIRNPLKILRGNDNALMAVREMEPGRMLVVVYKETTEDDGFVITAFPTRRLSSLNRRQQEWP
ncbi:MAG: hypothetical protein ACO3EZ_01785 [Prochlorotrichaceae cyanobacterium]